MSWRLLFVLPNIKINESIETDYLALVGYKDKRIGEIIKSQAGASKFLNNFYNDFNHKIEPSAIIYDSSKKDVLNAKEITDFRNLIGISYILMNWSFNSGQGSITGALFSNSFDFYPISINKDGDYLVDNSAMLSFYSKESPFKGMPFRDAPTYTLDLKDSIVFNGLLKLWNQKYIEGKKLYYIDKVFRSIEVAYFALSIPSKNLSSIYEFGIVVSMWVSAIENLLRPYKKNNKVNCKIVLDYLGKITWSTKTLNNRKFRFSYREKGRFKSTGINISQKLYHYIYSFRNDILHGNNVSLEKLKFLKKFKGVSLLNIGPNIYRAILIKIFVEKNIVKNKKRKKSDHWYDSERFQSYIINNNYENYYKFILSNEID